MSSTVNDFITVHTQMLWEAELEEFGRTANYWPGGDQANTLAISLIWLEGVEDEEVSPGRYSHAKVRNSDLPSPPALGDALEMDGGIFDVVRVNAYAYYFATIILQERL